MFKSNELLQERDLEAKDDDLLQNEFFSTLATLIYPRYATKVTIKRKGKRAPERF